MNKVSYKCYSNGTYYGTYTGTINSSCGSYCTFRCSKGSNQSENFYKGYWYRVRINYIPGGYSSGTSYSSLSEAKNSKALTTIELLGVKDRYGNYYGERYNDSTPYKLNFNVNGTTYYGTITNGGYWTNGYDTYTEYGRYVEAVTKGIVTNSDTAASTHWLDPLYACYQKGKTSGNYTCLS